LGTGGAVFVVGRKWFSRTFPHGPGERCILRIRLAGIDAPEHQQPCGIPPQDTLIEAWASLQELQAQGPRGRGEPLEDFGNPTVNFHGERRSNQTHQSSTDPEARLARKGASKEGGSTTRVTR